MYFSYPTCSLLMPSRKYSFSFKVKLTTTYFFRFDHLLLDEVMVRSSEYSDARVVIQ